jgi:hypothetical protein
MLHYSRTMSATITDVELVDPEGVAYSLLSPGFPFVCPLCGEGRDNVEYVRIWIGESSNPILVHAKCLLRLLRAHMQAPAVHYRERGSVVDHSEYDYE